MKFYIDSKGTHHRTQAEAKASGLPFEMRDISTSHQDLCDYLNSLITPVSEPEPSLQLQTEPAAYKNGDPTFVFMKSRHPEAIFMCVHCGRQNHNKASK